MGASRIRILHVCAEIFPFLKTGGLADVTAGLPPALAKLGCDVHMLVPGFPAFVQGIRDPHLVAELPPRFGASSLRLYFGELHDTGIKAYYIDAPGLFDRPGDPYADSGHQPYRDNYRRFALLGWMAARIADGLDFFWKPQVVHGHDWHSGLAFAYMKATEQASGRKLAGTLITIHNLAYQGNFPGVIFDELELPGSFFGLDGAEFYGQLSFLKAGLSYADKISTVSPTYAREIQGEEQGCGLDGLLRKRADDIHGILNGVDDSIWNPAKDKAIAANYDARSMSGKKKCRSALQKEAGLLEQNEAPVFCIVSRLVPQKGLHLLLPALQGILQRGGQLVMLGSGDRGLEEKFKDFAFHNPQQVSVQIGYDEQKAHRIIAGSDVIMVPSRYEPCGLTQLYGLLYGTLPLVHKVGGLADTVADCSPENLANGLATGFVFEQFGAHALQNAVGRVFALYSDSAAWKKVQRQGMQQKLGWDKPAKQYFALYKKLAT